MTVRFVAAHRELSFSICLAGTLMMVARLLSGRGVGSQHYLSAYFAGFLLPLPSISHREILSSPAPKSQKAQAITPTSSLPLMGSGSQICPGEGAWTILMLAPVVFLHPLLAAGPHCFCILQIGEGNGENGPDTEEPKPTARHLVLIMSADK